ncbi:MSCRAMM family protein [Dyadobacter sp. OTU695]|uniref:MSCRAMM family protein n=1 Tax=Dyadobacter sp. OTU695 TaxID=3043860 RepID=UPI00313CFA48
MTGLNGYGQSPITVGLANTTSTVVPGGHFTLFFDVKSSSPLPDSLREEIRLPEKWRLLSQRRPIRTAGDLSARYIYVIGTPAGCPSGDYQVRFLVHTGDVHTGDVHTGDVHTGDVHTGDVHTGDVHTGDVHTGGQEISTQVPLAIGQIRNIELFVVTQPEFIREGDTLRINYLIRNSGNNLEKFLLKSDHGKIDNMTDSLALEPGAGTNVTVSQVIPATDHNAWQASSSLSVMMTGGVEPVYSVTSIPVFSSKIRKIDRYFRFPVEVGGAYLSYSFGGRRVAAYQYQATGKGFLDQKERHYLDFTVRGPNQFVFPAIGTYDQYSLDYAWRKRLFVSAGDYTLQLNNLMEFGRFGRGLRVEQQFKKVAYTVFYQRARFFMNQKEALGGKFLFKINESANIGAHYASKNVLFHHQRFWSHMAGLAANVHTREFNLEGEVSTGRAIGKTDYGAFLRLQLAKKWISITSNVIYAGKHFYGFYNNSRLFNNNVGFNITRKLIIGASNNFSDVNPGLDANLYSVSPKDRSYMAYISYQPDQRNRFFLFYSKAERKDRQQPAAFHYSENFSNFSYNLTSEKFTLFYQGRYGYSRNHLAPDNSGLNESFSNLVQPTVRFFPWIWVGGYFEHQHTSKFSASGVVENLFFYGGNARVNVKRNLYASFLYRNNYAPDELYMRRTFLDASVILDLKRHVFSLSGGHSYIPNATNTGQNTLFFNLRYALRLNVPLGRKKNIGTVKGKLTGLGYRKQGNLIQLGSHKFMTDSTGMFSFEGVAPDRYYLSITQNESGSEGVVPVTRMPMLVDVRPDSLNVLEIPLTRTGSIVGKIEFLKAKQNGLSAVLAEKPPVLVKLNGENGSYLTELNAKGEFSFREIRPGAWQISVFIPGSQDRFVVEESSRELIVETDKTLDLTFRIRPNEKRIHFSERNFEVSVKK